MSEPNKLSPGQDAVVHMLAKLLAAAKRGEIDALAFAGANTSGALNIDFKGVAGLECQINMGLDQVKGSVALSFIQSQAPQPSRVLRPGDILGGNLQ